MNQMDDEMSLRLITCFRLMRWQVWLNTNQKAFRDVSLEYVAARKRKPDESCPQQI